MNQSLRKLRTEEFPNLVDFLSSMKNLVTSLANVNENGHIRIESRNQVTNNVESLNWMVESLKVIESITIFDN